MAQIIVFGDSISYGEYDQEGGGWVARLKRYLDFEYLKDPSIHFVVYNLSVDGNTSREILERLEFEIDHRRADSEPEDITVFATGINDSYLISPNNQSIVSEKNFQENILKIINIAHKYSKRIVFLGPNPVDEIKVNPMPWAPDKSYKNELIKKYNDIIKEICKEKNIFFIELFSKFLKLSYKKLLSDGAHPNTDGHKLIYEIVRDSLIRENLLKKLRA